MDKENEFSGKESIMAYIDIRKTAKINSILYYSGKTSEAHKGGPLLAGRSIIRIRRGGDTITSADTMFMWQNPQINSIDTSGLVNFTLEFNHCPHISNSSINVFGVVTAVKLQINNIWC